MLSSTPKVFCGKRRNATISSEYGSALDRMPTPMPARISLGSSKAMPAWAAPTGRATIVAASRPSDVACPPCTLPAILPKMM
ncbi:hypothetical protein D3C71_2037450 [compost metagenome]